MEAVGEHEAGYFEGLFGSYEFVMLRYKREWWDTFNVFTWGRNDNPSSCISCCKRLMFLSSTGLLRTRDGVGRSLAGRPMKDVWDWREKSISVVYSVVEYVGMGRN